MSDMLQTYDSLSRDALVEAIVTRDMLLTNQERQIEQLQLALLNENRKKFGPKTEKLSSDQLALSFEVPQASIPEADTVEVPAHKRVIPRGRKPLPANLPREEVLYTPDITHCSCCSAELVEIGRSRTEELEKVPAQLKIIEHVRPKLACPKCKGAGVLQAALPRSVLPIEGARPGPGLLADICVAKYVDQIPLHRQEVIFLRHGIELSRKRMCDWIEKVVELLLPLYNELPRRMLIRVYLQADETTLKVQDGDKPGVCHLGYLWGFYSPGPPGTNIIYFRYDPSRSGSVPKQILAGYQGLLQTDAYAGYNTVLVPDGARRTACLAHVRRKFVEVQKSGGAVADDILKLIARIYHEEKSATTIEARQEVREKKTRALADKLLEMMKQAQLQTLPRSALAGALAYAIKQEVEIRRIFEDGVSALDNNAIEREMKHIAIGRKNYLFAGSHDGAQRAAVLYSLLGTCKLNKINPWLWLKTTLERIHVETDIEKLMPFPPKTEQAGNADTE